MPSVTLTGRPGHGKSAVAVLLAIRAGGSILSDMKLGEHAAFKSPDGRDLRQQWDGSWDKALDFRCGVWLADEIGTRLDARKYDAMPADARRKIILHRQDDVTCIFTVQLTRLVDVIYREMSDLIGKVEKVNVPFGALGRPDRVRPSHVCKWCGKVKEPGSQEEWDDLWARTARPVWWRRLLAYGSAFDVTWYLPEQLDPAGKPLPGEQPQSVERFWWSNELMTLYDTQGATKQVQSCSDADHPPHDDTDEAPSLFERYD